MTTCRDINSGQSNFEYEYLGEFETELKNILGHESGAQVCSFDGKKQRSKIWCYCPFKAESADHPGWVGREMYRLGWRHRRRRHQGLRRRQRRHRWRWRKRWQRNGGRRKVIIKRGITATVDDDIFPPSNCWMTRLLAMEADLLMALTASVTVFNCFCGWFRWCGRGAGGRGGTLPALPPSPQPPHRQ